MLSPSAAVYGSVMVIAAGFAVLLARVPVQVSDCVNNIGTALTTPWSQFGVGGRGYLRPLIDPQTKLVLDLAPGREFAAFRAVQIAQVFAAFWLFARALRVRGWPQAVGALVATTVFAGSHIFATLVREGYPINTYLTVALCALAALNMATEARSRWWTDALVAGAFVLATGTIENGLLVWVIVVAAAIAGYRGVSRPGIATLTVLVAVYLATRFFVLDVGTPDLSERSTGFGFERLEPQQLEERFGANPLPLYAYNVMSAASTVLLGEPRNGIFVLVRAAAEGALRPWMIVELASGVTVTALMIWYAWASVWKRPAIEWTPGQRQLFVAAAVLAANAVIGYAYAKDQVMSVAAICIAWAAAAPIAALVESPPRQRAAAARSAIVLALAASSGSIRVAGQQHLLVHTAFVTRNDWATVDPTEAARRFGGDPAVVALIQSLRTRALAQEAVYPHVWSSTFAEDWFAH